MESSRTENLIWTVSNKYSVQPKNNIFILSKDFEKDFYKNCLFGLFSKKFNNSLMSEFIREFINKYSNKDDLQMILQLISEECIYRELLLERPALVEIREKYIKDKIYYYSRRMPNNIGEEIEYNYYKLKSKNSLQTNITIEQILKEIETSQNFQNTSEIITLLEYIFKTYFHIYENMNFEDQIKEFIEEVKKVEKSNTLKMKRLDNRLNIKSNLEDLEKFQIESAEFTNVEIIQEEIEERKNSDLSVNAKQEKDTSQSVFSHYGLPSKSKLEIQRIENEICIGPHENIKLHFSKGEYANDTKSLYFKELVSEQREENIKHYEENILVYKRNITQLKEIIKNSILSDLDFSTKSSSSGAIVPEKIYRYEYLKDPLIFKKEYREEYGTMSVDILLDSSASQEVHTNKVVAQAYIISSALTELNIPTRVLGFNNLFNYLILREYRNYNDPIIKNKNIFDYYPSGSNRDGLAIKYIRQSLKEVHYDKKILIVLSDGRPYDKITWEGPGVINTLGTDYEDDLALKDTAMEVLKAKMENIAVLGVFTGYDEDLEKEKYIYSKDFSYISNINRFSSIVGTFLKLLVEKY